MKNPEFVLSVGNVDYNLDSEAPSVGFDFEVTIESETGAGRVKVEVSNLTVLESLTKLFLSRKE